MDEKKARSDDGDRLADEPGEHPVGVGIGAATGATAGATVGVMGGIVGAAAGAVIGGMAGGLAGKIAAEALDPETEDSYWSNQYRRRPYVKDGDPYSTYRAAYKQPLRRPRIRRGRARPAEELERLLAALGHREAGRARRLGARTARARRRRRGPLAPSRTARSALLS